MKRTIFLLSFIILIIGCKTTQPVINTDSFDSVRTDIVISEDTNYTVPAEAFWRFVFECDSAYNVILKELEEKNEGVSSDVRIVEKIVSDPRTGRINKRLTVIVSAQTDSIATLSRTIEIMTEQLKRKNTVIVEKGDDVPVPFVPAWHWWVFVIFVVENLIIGFIIYLKIKGGVLKMPTLHSNN